jgi:methylenetetrahydrofolate dehydrogenase (NADP+) / methenyltetrahydrofolate cyclohydrolase
MPKIFSNNELKADFFDFLATQTNKCTDLRLEIIQIGDSLSSQKYIKIKQNIGKKLGIKVFHNHFLSQDEDFKNNLECALDSTKQNIISILNRCDSNKSGLIFQLPVPAKFDSFVEMTPLKCDVDILSANSGDLWKGCFLPPTVGAVDLVLKQMLGFSNHINSTSFGDQIETKLDFGNKKIAIIGQGKLVGKPLVKYFLDRNAKIETIDKNTPNPQYITQKSDIIISGAGVPNLVDSNWLRPDSVVVDVATSDQFGVICGDVDVAEISKNPHFDSVFVCPSPAGVGPITVYYLFWNLIKLHWLHNQPST